MALFWPNEASRHVITWDFIQQEASALCKNKALSMDRDRKYGGWHKPGGMANAVLSVRQGRGWRRDNPRKLNLA